MPARPGRPPSEHLTMSTTTIAGLLLVAVPPAFNAAFPLLAARFDYPDILRQPTAEVLARFQAGGAPLVLTWWAFALTAVLLAPLAVLVSRAIGDADPTLLAVTTTVGVLAAIVQFLGLVRWPLLVPYLARIAADPDASPARREAVDIVFQSFNRYLGVAVGEQLGYLLPAHGPPSPVSPSPRPPPPRTGSSFSASSPGRLSCSARWSSSPATSPPDRNSPSDSHPPPTSSGRYG
jgi:hypothetical protein